jgi:hypothetical protein
MQPEQSAFSRRFRLVAMAVSPLVLVAGCVRYTHARGTEFCGVRIPTGAVVINPTPVDPDVPAPGPAPASSTLPPQLPSNLATDPKLSLVRTSPGCDHGAVVSVTPIDGAYLYQEIRADDGGTAGLALARITRRITVSAWAGGRYLGSLVLAPPADQQAPSPTASTR